MAKTTALTVSGHKEQCDKFYPLLTDEAAAAWIEVHGKKTAAEARRIVVITRQETLAWGGSEKEKLHSYVQVGCTLKRDIPQMGPCRNKFQLQQGLKFPDPPTEQALVSLVPFPLRQSTMTNKDDQMAMIRAFKIKNGLPAWYDISFGSANNIAGMAMAHLHATGRDIFDGLQVRTDTYYGEDEHRLILYRLNGELVIGVVDWDEHELPHVATFAVGVIKKVTP